MRLNWEYFEDDGVEGCFAQVSRSYWSPEFIIVKTPKGFNLDLKYRSGKVRWGIKNLGIYKTLAQAKSKAAKVNLGRELGTY